MILLDTNVISEPLNERPNRRVIAWMRSRRPETLFLSVITVAELRTGVAMMPEGKRRKNLHDNVERWLLPRFLGRILPFDLECTPFQAETWPKPGGRAAPSLWRTATLRPSPLAAS